MPTTQPTTQFHINKLPRDVYERIVRYQATALARGARPTLTAIVVDALRHGLVVLEDEQATAHRLAGVSLAPPAPPRIPTIPQDVVDWREGEEDY